MSMAALPRKLKILTWAAASVCVSAALASAAEPPAPQAAITSLAGSLAAVSAGSATDAWAVGQTQTHKTLALHWNGTSWAQVPTPAPGAFGSLLSGVTEISPTNVWAVGSSNTSSGGAGLVLHWNGMRWARVPTPSAGISGLSGISAVSAADVWAVGRDLTATTGKTLVLHWDGKAWTQVSSPNPGATDNQLLGVHMTSATDGWAVGLTTNSLAQNLTLVLHWDGTAWTQVPSPSFGLSNGGSQLAAVSALTGSDAWASGLVFTNGGGEGTLLLHWNGMAWTRVAAPSPSPGGATGGSFLNGVAMVATADVWSAGGTFFDSTGREQTLLLHWNGMAWTRF